MSNIKNFINEQIEQLKKKELLERELKKVNTTLKTLNEEENKNGEAPSYNKATDTEFEKNLGNVVTSLGDAGKQIENMLSKMKAHKEHGMVNDSTLVGKHVKVRKMLLDMYKEIRAAEVKARDASNLKY